MTDLRSFLAQVRELLPREYLQVEQAVSPDFEIAAITTKLEQRLRTPILHFTHVAGTAMPVVTNVAAALPRIAKTAGWTTQELEQRLIDAYDHLLPPVPWPDDRAPPVLERVDQGEAVDLGILPRCRYTEVETKPYITAAVIVALDSESGVPNLSYHRLMQLDRRRSAIFMTPGGHLDRIFKANKQQGNATPIAAFIGSHPLWALGSLAAGSMRLDEYAVIGGVLGSPLEIVPASVDPRIMVPARAEIVLEGHILPDETVDEGPFGEFSGYSTARDRAPVVLFKRLGRRHDALYQDIVAGRIEHLTMSGTAIRAYLHKKLWRDFEAVADLHLPAPFTLYLKIDKSAFPDLDIRALLEGTLKDLAFIKYVYVFDPDIDLRNPRQVSWAIATRAQPDRDAVLRVDCQGTRLDPSEVGNRTAKWGLDATAKPALSTFPPTNRIPEDVLNRVDIDSLLRSSRRAPGKSDAKG